MKRILGSATVAITLLLGACSSAPEPEEVPVDHFGYAVGSSLSTSNAASALGVSDHADYLIARVYPAVFVNGPKGQLIPNGDFATAQAVPGPKKRVAYRIADKATYSDGVPVTCSDFELAITAGQRTDLFSSMVPLAEQVDSVECTPGSKDVAVVFKQDMGNRWRQLFSAGTVLPAHAIAAKAGMTMEQLHTAMEGGDEEGLARVGEIWSNGFSLKAFDPALQVASGPYRISSVREDGGVVLGRNPHYPGDAADVEEIVVWPKGADLAAISVDNGVEIADLIGVPEVGWVNRDDPYNRFDISFDAGELIEQLVLSNDGVFASPEARRAFAACIDQPAVAAASSALAGVETPPMGTRLLPFGDPLNEQTQGIAGAHLGVDIPAAEALRGQQIHIGYMGPDPRKAAMVEAIRVSCEPAGIDVVDAHAEGGGDVGQIHRQVPTLWGGLDVIPGPLDAVLVGIDPLLQYPEIDVDITDVEGLKAAEESFWQSVPTVPLCAQPRTFVIDRGVGNVVINTASAGIGWNMDRWQEKTQ